MQSIHKLLEKSNKISKEFATEKRQVVECLILQLLSKNVSVIANRFNIDHTVKKLFGSQTAFEKIEVRKSTQCSSCGSHMRYDQEVYAMYCTDCSQMHYEGQFVIDHAINPNYIHTQYIPMHTFDVWADHLLLYKCDIPEDTLNKILQIYDNTPNIHRRLVASAQKFKKILKTHKLTAFNRSISSLVKLRSDASRVPTFSWEDIKLVRNRYEQVLKLLQQMKNDENIRKNENVMHCKHYIVNIVQREFPE